MGGQLVEDIQEVGVVSVMLDYLKPVNNRLDDNIQNHPWLHTMMNAEPCAPVVVGSSYLSCHLACSNKVSGCHCT